MKIHRTKLIASVALAAVGCCLSLAVALGQISYPPVRSVQPTPQSTRYVPARSVSPDASQTGKLISKYNDLQRQIVQTIQSFCDGDDESASQRLRDQIVKMTTEQFDLRHQMRTMEMRRLQRELQDVEAKINRRQELKQEIIDRRVAELLDEDADLRWEPLVLHAYGTRLSIPSTSVMPVPIGQPSTATRYPSLPGPSVTNSMPANAPVPQAINNPPLHNGQEYMIDETTPMTMTPIPELTNGFSVAEAQLRLDYAEHESERIDALYASGAVTSEEKSQSDYGLRLAKLLHERAVAEFEGVRSVLELAVREAELDIERAKTQLEEIKGTHRNSPGAVTRDKITQFETHVSEKQLNLERVRTLLEIHLRTAKHVSQGASLAEPCEAP